jgi:bifunctional ADP-heptose synthase (sugar kinase/adenylyltransferase)
VAAVLAVALAARFSYPDAIRLANAAAGAVVGKIGTAAVSRAELMEALQLSVHTAPFSKATNSGNKFGKPERYKEFSGTDS